ncbi:MAG: hypothetical protein IPK60_08900 [Sandaracinaceae bacterium]|nr:hypothetical protein [Sandaracinaceae bacterium]
MRLVPTLLLAFLIVGCASRTSSLRTRFASDTGCSESAVTVVAQSNTRFNASGCGQAFTYTCTDFSGSSASDCTNERSTGPARPPPMRSTTPLDNPRMQRDEQH